jgi:hypothetical protein
VQKGGKIDLHSNNGQGPRPIHWASRYCRHKNIFGEPKITRTTKYYSACPLVGIGTPPTPLHLARVPLPSEPKGGEGTLACGWVVGRSQFWRLEKKLSTLPTLCQKQLAYTLRKITSEIENVLGIRNKKFKLPNFYCFFKTFIFCRNGHVAVVDLLLLAGVPVDATDNKVRDF